MHSKNIGLVGWKRQLSGMLKFFLAILGTRTACTSWGWLRFSKDTLTRR